MLLPRHLAVVVLCGLLVVSTVAEPRKVQGSDTCSTENTCYHNHDNLIKTMEGSKADCCSACTNHWRCESWTSWKDDDSQKELCNMFSTVGTNTTGGDCVSGSPGKRPTPHNFVFVFPDTLRAESFSSYGNPLNVTPNLDKFAQQGVRFDQAHVMHTQCSPSRCTMMTGRYMHILGHRTQTHLIQDYEANYFRYMKEAGYFIQYHGKNDMYSKAAFNLSVSQWANDIGYSSGDNAFEYGEAGYYSFLSTGSNSSGEDMSDGDYRAMNRSAEWLLNSPPEPFVAFLPTRGGHPPYGAPKQWHEKFSVDQVKKHIQLRPPNLPNKPTYMSFDNGIPHYRNLTSLDDDFFYQIQAVYLGQLAYTDHLFGQLMDALDKSGLAERTTVIFSSDHGDFGGDYHLVEKWPGSMDDVLTRVPAIVRTPGGAQGFVSKAPIQTADLLETMADLAGVNITHVRFAQSLRSQLFGKEGNMSRFVYSEGGFFFENEQMIEANECLSGGPKALYYPRGEEEAQPNGSPRAVMMRNLTAKLVYRPTGVSELYDLEKDPRELTNVFSDPKYLTLRTELMTRLLDWIVLTSDVTPEIQDSRGPPSWPYPIDPNCIVQPVVDSGYSSRAQYWEQPDSISPADYLRINGVERGDPLPRHKSPSD